MHESCVHRARVYYQIHTSVRAASMYDLLVQVPETGPYARAYAFAFITGKKGDAIACVRFAALLVCIQSNE